MLRACQTTPCMVNSKNQPLYYTTPPLRVSVAAVTRHAFGQRPPPRRLEGYKKLPPTLSQIERCDRGDTGSGWSSSAVAANTPAASPSSDGFARVVRSAASRQTAATSISNTNNNRGLLDMPGSNKGRTAVHNIPGISYTRVFSIHCPP